MDPLAAALGKGPQTCLKGDLQGPTLIEFSWYCSMWVLARGANSLPKSFPAIVLEPPGSQTLNPRQAGPTLEPLLPQLLNREQYLTGSLAQNILQKALAFETIPCHCLVSRT